MELFNQDRTPYAYIGTTGDRTYGHMNVTIFNAIGDAGCYWSRKPRLQITSQIGSSDYPEQRQKLYAERYGVVGGNDQMQLEELEAATKFMRKFERRMAKMEEESGPVKSYADLCWRVIVCSGTERAFVNPHHATGYGRIESLPSFNVGNVVGKVDLYKELTKLEAKIIDLYARRAA
jgi:hypothetical protein